MYVYGCGVAPDEEQAARWYRASAEGDFMAAQCRLGWMSAHGRGAPQDDREAVRWWRLASAQGDPEATLCYSAMCASGRGVDQDGDLPQEGNETEEGPW